MSIRTEKKVVRSQSGRDGIAVLGATDEDCSTVLQVNFEDGDNRIRARHEVSDIDIPTETLESLGREIIDFSDGNIWTTCFVETFKMRGKEDFDFKCTVETLGEALDVLRAVLSTNLSKETHNIRTQTLEQLIQKQIDGAKLEEIQQSLLQNIWIWEHCFIIPLLIAQLYNLECWIHYTHLENGNQPNVIRFKCQGMPTDLCIITCNKRCFHPTQKTEKLKNKLSPGDILTAPDSHFRFRLIRKIIISSPHIVTRYIVETLGDDGREPEERLMTPSTLQKSVAWHNTVYHSEQLPVPNDDSPSITNETINDPAQWNKPKKRSRKSSMWNKMPRISVIRRMSTMDIFDPDVQYVDTFEHLEEVRITVSHSALPHDLNGIYGLPDEFAEDFVDLNNGKDFFKNKNSNYYFYKDKDTKFYAVGNMKDDPLLRISAEELDIEIWVDTGRNAAWQPNIGNRVELEYFFDVGTDKFAVNAFQHHHSRAKRRSDQKKHIMSPLMDINETNTTTMDDVFGWEDGPRSPKTRDRGLTPVTTTGRAVKFSMNRMTYLNQYQLGKEIGQGSFAKVVFAMDTSDGPHGGRKVAVKILPRPKRTVMGKMKGIGGRPNRKKKAIAAPVKKFSPGGRKKKFVAKGKKNKFMPKGRPKGKGGAAASLSATNEIPQSEQTPVNREIAIMKKIRHPNCVRLYELIDDETKDDLYLILEYVNGGSLKGHIDPHNRLNMKKCRKWFCDFMKGIEYLHCLRIGHADLKPANILITRDGTAKVCDFGVSHLLGSKVSYIQFSETTPAYKAPEVIRDLNLIASQQGKIEIPEIRFRPWPADVWSAGVILLEMVTGINPYREAGDSEETERRILHFDPFGKQEEFFNGHNPIADLLPIDTPDDFVTNKYKTDPANCKSGLPELVLLLKLMVAKKPKERIPMELIKSNVWVNDYGNIPWENELPGVNVVETDIISAKKITATVLIEETGHMDNDFPFECPQDISDRLVRGTWNTLPQLGDTWMSLERTGEI